MQNSIRREALCRSGTLHLGAYRIFLCLVPSVVSANQKRLSRMYGHSLLLDIRLQVEVKDQNMVKHPLGIYNRISILYADPMVKILPF